MFTYSQSFRTWASPWMDESARNEFDMFFAALGDHSRHANCLFCGNPTTSYAATQMIPGGRGRTDWPDDIHYHHLLTLCPVCGWYRYWRQDVSDLTSDNYVEHNLASLNDVPVSSADAPLNELRRHLTKNWSDRRLLHPQKAEELVAAIFSEHLNCEVHYLTNGVFTPDGGVDFVLVAADTGIEYAFQVKRRLTDSPERVSPVREFVGSVASSAYDHGYYVTTSDRFTRDAREEMREAARAHRTRGFKISLVNGRDLHRLLREQVVPPTSSQHLARLLDQRLRGRKLTWYPVLSCGFRGRAKDSPRIDLQEIFAQVFGARTEPLRFWRRLARWR